LLAVLDIEPLEFLRLVAVEAEQLLLEQPLVVLLEMVVLGQLHLFLEHLLDMLVAVEADVEVEQELQPKAVELEVHQVMLLTAQQILAVAVEAVGQMAVLAAQV
jgi:hypothetical protein